MLSTTGPQNKVTAWREEARREMARVRGVWSCYIPLFHFSVFLDNSCFPVFWQRQRVLSKDDNRPHGPAGGCMLNQIIQLGLKMNVLFFSIFFPLTIYQNVQFLILVLIQSCWQDRNVHKCSLQMEGFSFLHSSKPDHSWCLKIWRLYYCRPSTLQLSQVTSDSEFKTNLDQMIQLN